MDFLLKHWLPIGVATFLLGMVLYGHYRGFLRMAVSMMALIFTIMIVRVASPYVSDVLRQNTFIRQTVEQGLLKAAGANEISREEAPLPAEQRSLIEHLSLPEQMREALIENNNSEVYALLGVNAFFDYIGAYLVNAVLNVIGAVLLFVIVYIVMRLLIRWLDLLARLPILSGINQIAGGLLGGVEGLLILWGLCLLVSAFSGTDWGMAVMGQIENNEWLTFLYRNNLFYWLVLGGLKL